MPSEPPGTTVTSFPWPTNGIPGNWDTHPAWLESLKSFRHPRDPSRVKDWETVPTQLAPNQFVAACLDAGLLVSPPLVARIACQAGLAELQALCTTHGLQASGPKPELAQRLAASCGAEMIERYGNRPIYVVGPTAAAAIERYVAERAAIKEQARTSCFEALKARDIAAALKVVNEFDAGAVLPRGPRGSAPSPIGPGRVSRVMSARPRLLGSQPDTVWTALQAAAAMQELWGESESGRWLAGVHPQGPLDGVTCARMVLFAGIAACDLANARQARASKVEVDVINDERSCPACRQLAGKAFSLASAPELPNPDCICAIGCRCGYRAVLG